MRVPAIFYGVSAVAITAIACSPDATAAPGGVAGAGVAARIVAIARDSAGYNLQVMATNRDVTALSYALYCPWQVEALSDSGWTLLAASGDCGLDAVTLDPGESLTTSVAVRMSRVLPSGTELRAIVTWGHNQTATSEPAIVE